MTKINQKQLKIMNLLIRSGELSSSSTIHSELQKIGEDVSLVTIKRTLSQMVKLGLLKMQGTGPAITYLLSVIGRLQTNIDPRIYCITEPDKRFGTNKYNFQLFREFLSNAFTPKELHFLQQATNEYQRRTANTSQTIQKKELERLVIELSWKSSKIEGNTYTLLDTEKLIKENKEATGHSKSEAQMILNHKDAFTYAHQNARQFKTLTRQNLEQLHAILVKNLRVGIGLRKNPVGVLGSKYKPLDNVYQITEAVEDLARAIAKMKMPYMKALTALVGISYIQPFADGNKRTSRLMANALLMAHNCAPLSYRSVDENEYREAMLVWYELNSLTAIKKIFISQYDFAARNYTVK